MNLYYYFDDEEFEYDGDTSQYISSLNLNDKIDIAKHVYEEMPEEDRAYAESEYNIHSSSDINVNNEDAMEWVRDVAFDLDFYDIIEEYAEPDIIDYFEDDAREAYEDSKLSPEEYNDWRQSDYI